MLVPVLWLEESASITDEAAANFRALLIDKVRSAKTTLAALCASSLAVALASAAIYYRPSLACGNSSSLSSSSSTSSSITDSHIDGVKTQTGSENKQNSAPRASDDATDTWHFASEEAQTLKLSVGHKQQQQQQQQLQHLQVDTNDATHVSSVSVGYT